jgi:hypothetical protein
MRKLYTNDIFSLIIRESNKVTRPFKNTIHPDNIYMPDRVVFHNEDHYVAIINICVLIDYYRLTFEHAKVLTYEEALEVPKFMFQYEKRYQIPKSKIEYLLLQLG